MKEQVPAVIRSVRKSLATAVLTESGHSFSVRSGRLSALFDLRVLPGAGEAGWIPEKFHGESGIRLSASRMVSSFWDEWGNNRADMEVSCRIAVVISHGSFALRCMVFFFNSNLCFSRTEELSRLGSSIYGHSRRQRTPERILEQIYDQRSSKRNGLHTVAGSTGTLGNLFC